MLKTQAEEEEPGRVRNDSAFVTRESVRAEHWQIDPAVVRQEASAPDDHARLDYRVAAHREAITFVFDPGDTGNARIAERSFWDSDERITAARYRSAHPATESRFGRRAIHDGPEPIEQVAA